MKRKREKIYGSSELVEDIRSANIANAVTQHWLELLILLSGKSDFYPIFSCMIYIFISRENAFDFFRRRTKRY